jgi:uncharacterized protein YjiS (DUF1127 family)
MSTLFEAPALNPAQRHFKALLLRLRRFVNRSVANMLANRERQATEFMLKKLSDRDLKDIGLRRTHVGVRSAVFGLVVASSLTSVVTQAQETVVRDHRGGRAQTAPRTTFCDSRNHTHTPDGGCVTATGTPTVRDHRSR